MDRRQPGRRRLPRRFRTTSSPRNSSRVSRAGCRFHHRFLLPLLRRQSAATLVNVGAGLAFVPLVAAPVYSAIKVAVRAFTTVLRGTSVQVIELLLP